MFNLLFYIIVVLLLVIFGYFDIWKKNGFKIRNLQTLKTSAIKNEQTLIKEKFL